jgi:hypothetical protein
MTPTLLVLFSDGWIRVRTGTPTEIRRNPPIQIIELV